MIVKDVLSFLSLSSVCVLLGGALSYHDMTPLQRHVSFFDRNHDGFITVDETAESLRKLGIGSIKARISAVAIHAGLSRKAGNSWRDPLTLDMSLIHHGKHSSDTGIYDEDGNFVGEVFEFLFEKYADVAGEVADGPKIGLSVAAVNAMVKDNHVDFLGHLAAEAEFGLLLDIAGEACVHEGIETTMLSKHRLQSFYNGALLFEIANEPLPS